MASTPVTDAVLADFLDRIATVRPLIQALILFGSRARGEPPKCGVLLGAKRYRASASAFARGERVRIFAEQTYSDENGFAVYDCRIDGAHGELAAADPEQLYE